MNPSRWFTFSLARAAGSIAILALGFLMMLAAFRARDVLQFIIQVGFATSVVGAGVGYIAKHTLFGTVAGVLVGAAGALAWVFAH